MTGPRPAPAPPHDPGEGVHSLQDLLFGFGAMPSGLYRRSPAARRPVQDPGTGALIGTAGDVVSFNSYFNAFFARYWRQYSNVARLGLRVRSGGPLRVRVVGIGPARRAVLVDREIDGRDTIWLPDTVLAPDGPDRLAVVVQWPGAARLETMSYVTDTQVLRAPVLSLGLCSFNNEPCLARTLRGLADNRPQLPEIAQVFVVNQGAPFADAGLRADLKALDATVIAQRNLGGTGGFTRTMLEATRPGTPFTHHLLMDDDVTLDPAMLRRAVDFLAHARADELVLGGTVLNQDSPARILEAGSQIGELWRGARHHNGLGVDRARALRALDHPQASDYSAWPFCLMPLSSIRRLEMPYPLFLHGDDVEYGLRHTKAGIETVTLPGLAVWHSPEAAKPREWISYYDFRNRLVIAALYPQVSMPFAPTIVLGMLLLEVLCHRYQRAAGVRLAVRDYLAGPQAVFGQPADVRHQTLIAALGRLPGPEIRSFTDAGMPPPGPAAPHPHINGAAILHLARLYALRVLRITLPHRDGPLLSHPPEAIQPANLALGAYAIPLPGTPGRALVHAPQRLQLWRGLAAGLWWALRYATGYRRAARAWRQAAPRYRHRAHWQEVFAAAPPQDTGGAP